MPCWKQAHHGRTPHELQGIHDRGDDALETAWVEFCALPFPAGLDDLDDLDGAAAGCIATYLAQGSLDGDGHRTLQARSEALAELLPRLSGDAALFVGTLLSLCRAVLREAPQALADVLEGE